MHVILVLGFRRVSVDAGVIATPLALSFESSGGMEPTFQPIYNRRLTMDAITSTKVYNLVHYLYQTGLI